MTNYKDVKLRFVSPKEFKIEDDLRALLTKKGVLFEETTDMLGALDGADAVYMTRVQDEYDSNGESSDVDITSFQSQA